MENEESQPQDDPDNGSQSVEESVVNIRIREETGRWIDCLELTIGGKSNATKTGM